MEILMVLTPHDKLGTTGEKKPVSGWKNLTQPTMCSNTLAAK